MYGNLSFDSYLQALKKQFPEIELAYYQSNVEGELINKIHETGFTVHGIIINPGGYGHTSVAIADALKAVPAKVIEVHLSNVFAREEFRKNLVTASFTDGLISGFGLDGYRLAILSLINDRK